MHYPCLIAVPYCSIVLTLYYNTFKVYERFFLSLAISQFYSTDELSSGITSSRVLAIELKSKSTKPTEFYQQIQNVLQLGPREGGKHPHQHLVW